MCGAWVYLTQAWILQVGLDGWRMENFPQQLYIYINPVFLCIIKNNQNYLTDYVCLWINFFITFTGRYVYSHNMSEKKLPILSPDMLQR